MPDNGNDQQQGNSTTGGAGSQQQTPPPQQQQGSTTGANTQQTNTQGETPETWESWLASRPDSERSTITALYESKTTGLRSALQNEREGRSTLEKQIRDLQKSAEKGSENERKLTEMVGALETANRRSEFLEEAIKPEIGLSDVKAAWIIIQASPDDYITKRGVDFALLKERHPSLFKTVPQTPRGNAGSGTTNDAPSGANMNDFIRKAAGR